MHCTSCTFTKAYEIESCCVGRRNREYFVLIYFLKVYNVSYDALSSPKFTLTRLYRESKNVVTFLEKFYTVNEISLWGIKKKNDMKIHRGHWYSGIFSKLVFLGEGEDRSIPSIRESFISRD